ncbi:MAG TPA: DUF5076 domain-containing protein [Myxococcaceae bacterium]|nr:DUF5076 domain-containing protein [Myxococcaceae bacterium]
MSHANELTIPPRAADDGEAREVLRFWSARGRLHVTVRADAYRDPAAWGIVLADLARHVANAYALEGHARADALARFRAGFDAEWGFATTDPFADAAPRTGRRLRAVDGLLDN